MEIFKNLTKSDKIKMDILEILADYEYHTPSEIAKKLSTNGVTILNNCLFLVFLGLVELDVKHVSRKNYFVKLNHKFKYSVEDLIKKMNSIKMI